MGQCVGSRRQLGPVHSAGPLASLLSSACAVKRLMSSERSPLAYGSRSPRRREVLYAHSPLRRRLPLVAGLRS